MRAYYSNEAWVRYSDHYVTRFSIQLEYHDLPLSNRLVGLPLTVLAATGLFTAAAVTATSSGNYKFLGFCRMSCCSRSF